MAARLVLDKLNEEDVKKKAKQEMLDYSDKQKNSKKEFDQNINTLQVSSHCFCSMSVGNKPLLFNFFTFSFLQDEIRKLSKQKEDLLDKLKEYQAQLEAQRAEALKLKEKFKVGLQIRAKFLPLNKTFIFSV